jgi:hypothetical protein
MALEAIERGICRRRGSYDRTPPCVRAEVQAVQDRLGGLELIPAGQAKQRAPPQLPERGTRRKYASGETEKLGIGRR